MTPGTVSVMIPDDYHDFFLGAVTVAGALVGLLFVAISVHPGGVGHSGELTMRIRATSALSAFLDALFVSLLALKPGGSLSGTATGLGIAGALTMVTLLTLVVRRGRGTSRWQIARMLALIVGQGAVYLIQITDGLHLRHHPAAVGTEASLLIGFIAFGMVRAWEYVGGQRTGLWGAINELTHAPTAEKSTDEAS